MFRAGLYLKLLRDPCTLVMHRMSYVKENKRKNSCQLKLPGLKFFFYLFFVSCYISGVARDSGESDWRIMFEKEGEFRSNLFTLRKPEFFLLHKRTDDFLFRI